MIKVSLVVAIYNVEEYLNQCLLSIVNQTYKNLEIILVDDGSSDSSAQICDDFASKDQRIVVIHKENGGLASARLAGAEHITGDYVLNVDGDDWLALDMVEKLCLKMTQEDADVTMCTFSRAYPDGSIENVNMVANGVYNRERLEKEFFPFLVPGTDAQKCYPCVWTKMFRTKSYLTNLKYYVKELAMGEDVVIIVPNFLGANKIVCINEQLYFYRINPGQMTKKYKQEHFNNEVLVQEKLKCIAKDFGYELGNQLKRRYVNVVYEMTRIAVKQGFSNKQVKSIIKQWVSVDFFKNINKKEFTLREKIKYLLLKNSCLFLIRFMISMV